MVSSLVTAIAILAILVYLVGVGYLTAQYFKDRAKGEVGKTWLDNALFAILILAWPGAMLASRFVK